MQAALLVFIGGGLGSVLRWLVGAWALRMFGPQFPTGTVIVNLLGCFMMGLAFRMLPEIDDGMHHSRLLLMTGALGGFTTFSAFALDASALWAHDELQWMLVYVLTTCGGTLLAVTLGLVIGKWLVG